MLKVLGAAGATAVIGALGALFVAAGDSAVAQTPATKAGAAPVAHGDAPAAKPAAPQLAAFIAAGEKLYAQRCAVCHDNPDASRAPATATVRRMPAQQIRLALSEGVMKAMATGMTAEQIEQVTTYLTADAGTKVADWVGPLRCAADQRVVDLEGRPTLAVFGVDHVGTRRLTAAQAGLRNADLARLEVAWTLPMPQSTTLRSQPVIVGSTMFYSAGQANTLLALDTRTGCVKWDRRFENPLRTTLTYGPLGDSGRLGLIFADSRGQLHAVDPKDGSTIWSMDPRHDKTVPITGAPILYKDRVIVPISASSVARATDPKYTCCTTSGAVSAVDAATGKLLWTARTMPPAKPIGRRTSVGVEMYGPSGAPIWATPSIDPKRNLVYAATGENTSPPATETSNAVMAIDLDTGAVRWVKQALANDIWNMACRGPNNSGPNCPFTAEESVLKDYDFGAQPIVIRTPKGRDLILAGQKSGDVWAFDPNAKGATVWNTKVGEGSALGGIHWGLAVDGRRVFAPVSDPAFDDRPARPGMYALDVDTGRVLWSWAATPDCEGERGKRVSNCTGRFGLSAAPIVVDRAVLAGSLDGKLRAWDAETGRVLFTYDTVRDFPSRNGLPAKGGSIDAHGVWAADGMVFVNSGYGSFGQTPGNVLVAFRPRR